MRTSTTAKISATQDQWERRATDAAIAAAMDTVGVDGPIRKNVMIGALTKHEWGWLCSAATWGWIKTRAEQAATEGWNEEHAIRATGLTPDPWLAGAVTSILPELFDALPDLDYAQPVGSWSKDTVTEFLTVAFTLCTRAVAARDAAEAKVTGSTNADVTARRMNAAAGNSRMTPAELDDDIPF